MTCFGTENEADFKESLWCIVEAEGKFLVGVWYRSTSSDNDECWLKLLRTSNISGISHFMIMGDFNFANIDYEHGTVKAGANTTASKFFEETQDLFLVQLFDSRRIKNNPHWTTSSTLHRRGEFDGRYWYRPTAAHCPHLPLLSWDP